MSLGIPHLWATIHLPQALLSADSNRIDRIPTLPTLQTWLASSHPLPIKVTIDIRKFAGPWYSKREGIDYSYIRELCAHSERLDWSDIRFRTSDGCAIEFISVALQGATLPLAAFICGPRGLLSRVGLFSPSKAECRSQAAVTPRQEFHSPRRQEQCTVRKKRTKDGTARQPALSSPRYTASTTLPNRLFISCLTNHDRRPLPYMCLLL